MTRERRKRPKTDTLRSADEKAMARIQRHADPNTGQVNMAILNAVDVSGAGYFRGDEAAFPVEVAAGLVLDGTAVPVAELTEDERFALCRPNQRPDRFPHRFPGFKPPKAPAPVAAAVPADWTSSSPLPAGRVAPPPRRGRSTP